MTDLLLRADALPGLLDGWVGPVLTGPTEDALTLRWSDEAKALVESGPARTWPMFLDLSLPECRDRVARVLARAVGHEEKGAIAPAWMGYPRADNELSGIVAQYWELGWDACTIFSHVRNEPHWRHVPGLRDLNPSDPTLLPDGSRRVDAMALKMVAEHVGVGRG